MKVDSKMLGEPTMPSSQELPFSNPKEEAALLY